MLSVNRRLVVRRVARDLLHRSRDGGEATSSRFSLRIQQISPTVGHYHMEPSIIEIPRHFFSTKPDTKNDDNNDTSKDQSDKANPKNTTNEKEQKESFQDMLGRMEQEGTIGGGGDNAGNRTSDGSNQQFDNLLRSATDVFDSFTTELNKTWQELLKSGERKDINKKILHVNHPVATPEGDAEYTGPVDIMVIDESEKLTAWERMQRRLTEAPIIQDILTRTEEFYEKSGAKNVKKRVDHLAEDAREAWETSQNPWVYRVSSVYETLTAETPESIAVKELRILDPDFTLDDWREDVVEHTLPQIMGWFLQGKINQLKPWLGESVFKRIAAEITARQKEGVQIDTHVLGIMNSEILACEPDEVNKGSPIIVLHFMCQQINCVRKKEDGTIVEGREDDIRANSYVAAFQREYNEEKGELNWKIVDFRFNGAIAYL